MRFEVATGVSHLDKLLGGLHPGDNVVWCVDQATSYWNFVEHFARAARERRRGVVCVSWSEEDFCGPSGLECDFRFDPNSTGSIKQQLDAFLELASARVDDLFVFGIPAVQQETALDESTFLKVFGKISAHLFWLDAVAYFGFLESQLSREALLHVRGMVPIVVRARQKEGLSTVRILKARGRHSIDTRVVYSLQADTLTPLGPGEPTLRDFKHLVETGHDAMWVAEMGGGIKYINRDVSGYSREEILAGGLSLFAEAQGARDEDSIASAIREVMRTGRSVSGVETVFLHKKTGAQEYFTSNIVPLLDGEDRIFGFLGTSTDVTEMRVREELLRASEARLRKATARLRESESKYRRLFRNASDAIFVTDRNACFVDVNPAACELSGYSSAELVGMLCFDLYPDFREKEYLELLEAAPGTRYERLEELLSRRDGRQMPVEISGVMLNGQQLLWTVRDTTKRREADIKLRASEEMFRSMIRQAGLGITYIDTNAVHLDVNDAFSRMTGFSREEIVGVHGPRPYWPESHIPEITAALKRAVEGRQGIVETVFKRKNGGTFPVRIHPSPVRDHTGRQVGTIAIFEDISDWKNLQEQLIYAQKVEVTGALAGGVAHEFNNLHGGIQGHVELALADDRLPAQVRKDLEVVLRTLQRASRVTNQLLTFARRAPVHRELSSLSEIIEDPLKLFAREFENEGIQIEVGREGDIPNLFMDAAQIGQVVLNLFMNARDAMRGSDFKRLRIDAGIRGKRAFIRVSDTGCGIVHENIERIFEPFFTTKEGTGGKEARGSGLGLSVSETIVREHGGQIEVSSVKGEGTVFTVWLPAEPSGLPDVVPPPSSTSSEARGSRILVIDDEAVVRSLLERALRRAGYVVESTNSGGAGLHLLAEREYDLVLVDLALSDVKGVDVLRAIERMPEPRRPATVVLSGRPGIEESQELRQLPITGVLHKPITLESLYATLERALSKKEGSLQETTGG